MGGALPEGVIPHPNGTLVFGRPLSLSDAGTYQCAAQNEVGTGKAEVEINIAGRWQHCQHDTVRLVMVTYIVWITCIHIHLTLPTPLLTRRFYRVSRGWFGEWKHADDHRRSRGRRAADLDAHHHHHCHLLSQAQEPETEAGADWEEVRWDNMMFN